MEKQEALVGILENMQFHLFDRVRDDVSELLEYVSNHKECGLLERKYGISVTYKEFLDKIKEALREIKGNQDEKFNKEKIDNKQSTC